MISNSLIVQGYILTSIIESCFFMTLSHVQIRANTNLVTIKHYMVCWSCNCIRKPDVWQFYNLRFLSWSTFFISTLTLCLLNICQWYNACVFRWLECTSSNWSLKRSILCIKKLLVLRSFRFRFTWSHYLNKIIDWFYIRIK